MRIAFPVDSIKGLNSKISKHFGRASQFLIVEFNSGNAKLVKALNTPDHAYGAYPEFLHDARVDIVVVSSMGEKAKELFENLGVGVFDGFNGTVSSALDRLKPKLTEMERDIEDRKEKEEKARKALERAREKRMNFYLDLAPGDEVFLSVKLSDDKFLSFDGTRTGPRLLLQRPISSINVEQLGDPEARYKTLHFIGSRLLKIEDQRWWIVNGKDVVEGIVWDSVWEGEIDPSVVDNIKQFAHLVSENEEDLTSIKDKLKEFNDWLYETVKALENSDIPGVHE